MRILVMGLPGSGKTTLAKSLAEKLNYHWINGDQVREDDLDWDFTEEGRNRQALRMRELSEDGNCVCDFICPTEKTRELFGADFTIWMDTIIESKFEDTNKLFEKPKEDEVNIRIPDWDYSIDAVIARVLIP